MNPRLSSACNFIDGAFTPVNDDEYIKIFMKECLSRNIGIIIPTIDTQLEKLSKYRNIFQEKGINIVISDINIINICRKKKIIDFLKLLELILQKYKK